MPPGVEEVELDLRSELGLGSWLAALRARANLTQAELAQAAGVSQRNVQRWEAGQNAPGAYELLRVFDALGVKIAELGTRPGAVNTELRAIRNALVHHNAPPLTPLQLEIVMGIGNGESDESLAERLGVSKAMVRRRFREAAEMVAEAEGFGEMKEPMVPLPDRLAALEARVAELPTAEDLGSAVATLQAAIDRLASRGSREVPQEKPAGKRGAR